MFVAGGSGYYQTRGFDHFRSRFVEDEATRPGFQNNVFKRVPVYLAADLVSPFTMDEIKKAAWECGGDKAPRPDGFSFNFIKKFWAIMKVDIKEVMDYYHTD